MGLLRILTRNSADTRSPSHADLAPLTLPGDAEAARAAVVAAVAKLARWTVAGDPGAGELLLTRRTRLVRYVDDIRLTFAPAPGGTLVHAESKSRVGKGDLGQNRRNILELWRALSPTG